MSLYMNPCFVLLVWTWNLYAASEIEVYYYYYLGCYCLHSGSDVALGCHSDNMIFAKLCDFSHAVSMEDELTEEDEEDIRQLLLPAILPPEVEITCNCILAYFPHSNIFARTSRIFGFISK